MIERLLEKRKFLRMRESFKGGANKRNPKRREWRVGFDNKCKKVHNKLILLNTKVRQSRQYSRNL